MAEKHQARAATIYGFGPIDCEAWSWWALVTIIWIMLYELLCIFKNGSLIQQIHTLMKCAEQLQHQKGQLPIEGNGRTGRCEPSVWCPDTESDYETEDEDEPSAVVASHPPSPVQEEQWEDNEKKRLVTHVNGVHSHRSAIEGEVTPTEECNGINGIDESTIPAERCDSRDSDSAVDTTSLPPSRDSLSVGTEV